MTMATPTKSPPSNELSRNKALDLRLIAESFGRPQRNGRAWRCLCPICGAHALTIRAGTTRELLAQCWSCKDWKGIMREIERLGFNTGCSLEKPSDDEIEAEEQWRTAKALRWLNEADEFPGSPAERYLSSRGLDFFGKEVSSDALLQIGIGFHPRMWHPSGAALPAMITSVKHCNKGECGIHATFLKPNGSGKADIEPNKATYGPVGGGGVIFCKFREDEEFIIGEGIESTLSIMKMTGLRGAAALSAGGMERLILPKKLTRVLIAADNDPGDKDDPKGMRGQKAAQIACARWRREGRDVRVVYPKYPGTDFNDWLVGKGMYGEG